MLFGTYPQEFIANGPIRIKEFRPTDEKRSSTREISRKYAFHET
jgi:hypothetical protein